VSRHRWLVTGAAGMLGHDLVAVLRDRPDVALTALDRTGVDLTDPVAVHRAVVGAQVVVNAAGWTDVDGAEAAEPAATAVNGAGVANLARAAGVDGAVLLHVSTDYVFGGNPTGTPRRTPYPEDAPTAPVNAYGRSKLAGEQALLTILPTRGYLVRTAWLYGGHGRSFVATMLGQATRGRAVDVVDDQVGQPTWTLALARRLVALGEAALAGTAPPGIYHGTCSGQTTWYGLAAAVYAAAGADPGLVRATTSRAHPRPARRPGFSVLGHDRWSGAGLAPMPPWLDCLHEALTSPAFAALARSG
jgi:dTDP-4-dehydrorhamnose reductase